MNWKTISAVCIPMFLAPLGLLATPNPPDAHNRVVLTGVVESASGKPIGGVWVLNLMPRGGRVETASDGSFRIEKPSGRLLFNHPLYAPEFVLVRPEQPLPMKIVLRPRTSTEWKLPACTGIRFGDQARGKLIRLKIARSFQVFKSRDADYDLITVVERRSQAILRFWRIGHSAGMPEFDWYDQLVILSTRPLTLAGREGFDVRGTASDGKVSRWVGTFYTHVVYSKVPADIAVKFDRIIDSACYY